MSMLGRVIETVESYGAFVEAQVKKARTDEKFARELLTRWSAAREKIDTIATPTGLQLPRQALPQTDEPSEIARYLFGEGLPGTFPFLNGAYPEMYLHRESLKRAEEPTRLFSGLGLAEDTNKRFHYLTKQQRSVRLSTAFDGPTLYGLDSDHEGAFGKVGEGGVAIDTVEDMERLYDGFDLGDPNSSISMTINGPAPTILAMYVAAAKRRLGDGVVPKLRGTIQADILKEVQAQNENLFPVEASLRFLTDMAEFTTKNMPRWYPISISGYHIGEAGATPVQQAAYTLSNGFAYVELFRARGMNVNEFGPRLSFFLDCGLDIEYLVLARVCRRIWAIGMRDAFGAGEKAQLFKLHTQTSGRSLIAHEFKNNLTRTATELIIAYINATNSSHSNSADEPFTTPNEEYVRLAAHAQAIILEETGLFKFMMNTLSGSPGMKILEGVVERAILDEFREIDRQGGVLAAMERRYQRSQIQEAAYRYEQQIYDNVRPIIGLNRYRNGANDLGGVEIVRTPRNKKELQVARLRKFKKRNAKKSERALERLARVAESDGNVFAELIDTVETCSLGQITEQLHEVVGHYRPMV
ncbi:MAG: methylmalonyl-CoA mutase family protein [Verrucomicrobiota bacterium]|nr:methylmalonyl-CoA mutase family protein [Verrucomicrobiota bacterium]